jgi:hypothetical protein
MFPASGYSQGFFFWHFSINKKQENIKLPNEMAVASRNDSMR